MRLIFAGTPAFAERALLALLEAGHEIALVLTRADRPAGRGQQLQQSPVKQLAVARGLPVFQPRTLREPDAQRRIAETGADAMVVAAYGLILPPEVLGIPRLGCINIHASLLPRWRGAAPIQRAIEAGDAATGVTIMQMDEGLDTGAMLLTREIPIDDRDTGGTLHDKLAECGSALIVEALARLERGDLPPVAQPADGATYATKIDKSETAIDWRQPALRLADRVRAFDPFPGSVLRLECASDRPQDAPGRPGLGSAGAGAGGPAPAGPGGAIKLWRARTATSEEAGRWRGAEPGTVLEVARDAILVACGEGALWLEELQKAGGRRLPAAEFLRGFPLSAGDRFAGSGEP